MSAGRPTKNGTILLDTSVAVAVCSLDHSAHAGAVAVIGNRMVGLAGHAWFETFSVLTRLPPPQRRSAAEVLTLLRENFPATVYPTDAAQRSFAAELDHLLLAGGAVYDGLVALAARSAGLPLLSRDRRARSTYAAMGTDVSYLE